MRNDTEASVLALDLSLAMSRLRSRLRTEQASVTTGQTMSQLSILGRIAESGPITASRLAQLEHVRQQSVWVTVATLRRDGLIDGEPDPADGRKTLLRLSEAGEVLVESILRSRGFWLARAIEQETDPGEREILEAATQLLSRLADARLSDTSVQGG